MAAVVVTVAGIAVVGRSAAEERPRETPSADNNGIDWVAGIAASRGTERQPPAEVVEVTDLERAQGRWDVVRHWSGGLGIGTRDGSGEPLGPQVVLSGERITLEYRPGDPAEKKSEYVIKRFDDTAKPGHVDVAHDEGGRTIVRKGIYLLEKGIIKCEFASPGERRPRGFEARGRSEAPTHLLILRRVEGEGD